MSDPLGFRAVCEAVHTRLADGARPDWDHASWDGETHLSDDLHLDSLDMLRLFILVEELADHYEVEPDGFVLPKTLGEVYAGYLALHRLAEEGRHAPT